MADNTSIPIIVQGNSFSLAIPLQIYVIDDNEMVLEDYTPDPTDEVTIQLKGSRRNYTYTPTIEGNIANIDLGGYELADNYAVVVTIVKQDGKRLRSFRTDQFFIVESSDDLTQDDIIAGLEENVIYLNAQAFIAGADGRGIGGIQKTGTSGLVDTYTIYYTDNTTSTFQVTNGQQGEQGTGITSIEKTGTSGLIDTYTITLSNGQTSTFEVTNGQDGHDLGLAAIINNLTTGGTTDALSAEMGKELNEKFPAFKAEIMEQVNQAVESIEPIVIEGDVTNSADEEDLTSVNDVLKFKDKLYSPLTYSGLGRKYLRKNVINGINTLTQSMFKDSNNNDLENTVFYIQYDYDLGGETITMPAGATLKFNGGSLKNGTLVGNDCIIDGDADIRCGITGVKNDVTHLKWFTKESDKNTAFARALACAGDTILDGDNEEITLTQTITFGANNSCDLRNLAVNFTASANNQNMFLFDSSTQWKGITHNITHCTFALTNPNAYQNVHCVHLRRWYNTSRSEISDVYVKDFSGYMFVCESYLQEMNFVRFKGSNVGGFISFNREYNTSNAFGDKGEGSSNIISFTQCGIDGGLNTNTTITDVVSVTKLILCTFDSCVFQGTKNNVVENTYYFTEYNDTYICNVNSTHTWSEFVSSINRCCIGENICVTSNAHFAGRYKFEGKRNALTTELQPITEQAALAGTLFEISEGAYPTIRLAPSGNFYYLHLLISNYANKCNLIIDSANVGGSTLFTNMIYYREGTSVDMMDNIRTITINYCKRFFIYDKGIRILRQYATGGTGPLYIAATKESGRLRYLESGNRAYYHIIYRVYPLIDVTSENLSLFDSAGITRGVGALQGGGFNPFAIGQSLNPDDNVWYELTTQVRANITNPVKYSYGRYAMDIAVCEVVDGTYPLRQNIIIDPNDNTKLINLTNYKNDYGETADAPTPSTTMYGHKYFDTTINKVIFWDGTKWIDGDGFMPALRRGTSIQRPSMAVGNVGFNYFDTTINKNLVALPEMVAKDETITTIGKETKYVENPFTDGKYVLSITTHSSSYLNIWMSKGNPEESSTDLVWIVRNQTSQATVNVNIENAEEYPYLKLVNGDSKNLTIKIVGHEELLWKENDGATAGVKRNGTTAERPASADIYVGFQYWDTDLGKMIAWSGSSWLNLDGSALS